MRGSFSAFSSDFVYTLNILSIYIVYKMIFNVDSKEFQTLSKQGARQCENKLPYQGVIVKF